MFTQKTDDGRAQVGIGTLIVFIAMVLVAAIAAGVLINTAGMLQSQAEATGEESTDLVSERIDVTSSVGIVSDSTAHNDGGANRGELSEIRLGVTGSAGADDIDLSETVIQVVGPEGQDNLVMADGGDQTMDDSEGFDQVDENIGHETGGSGTIDDEATAANINPGYFAVEDDGEFISTSDAVINEDNGDLTIVFNPKVEPFGGEDDLSSELADLDSGDSLDEIDVFGTGDDAMVDIVSPSGATTQVQLTAPDIFSDDGEAVRL